jgi:peptidoglycan/LPS O-acetylase OafA/YrhL
VVELSAEPRYPSLDGLRGIAIAAVVFTHLFPPALAESQWWLWPGALVSKVGWMGVDLFFVLSGFLITGVLIAQRTAPNYFAAFYWRRALRILPLYYLLLLGETIYWGSTLTNPWWPYWFFASNLSIIFAMAWTPEIAVSWTLSLEEQFYLTWPFALRFMTLRRAAILAIALVALSLAIRLAVMISAPEKPPGKIGYLFGGPFSHLDGLALGAFVRLIYERSDGKVWLNRFAGTWWIWLALLATVMTIDHLTGWPEMPNYVQVGMARFGFTLMALLFTSLMLQGLLRDGFVRRACDTKPLMRLGDYSYCIYLFHVPIGALVKWAMLSSLGDTGALPVFAISCAAIVSFAHLTYWTIEEQARKRKNRIPYNEPIRENASAPSPSTQWGF